MAVAFAAAGSVLIWSRVAKSVPQLATTAAYQRGWLLPAAWALVITGAVLSSAPVAGGIAFALLAVDSLLVGLRTHSERSVWHALAALGAALGYAAWHGLLPLANATTPLLLIAIATGFAAIAQRLQPSVVTRPLRRAAIGLPVVAIAAALVQHLLWSTAGASTVLAVAGAFYFWRWIACGKRAALLAGFASTNGALALLWHGFAWTDPQLYLIPIGASIIALVKLCGDDLPQRLRDRLNWIGALTILVSPTFHVFTGSWLHLFTWMACSLGVVVTAIGLRVRALGYAGTAFLLAALIAMVVRGSVDHPELLWVAGLGLGGAVVTLAALAERNREKLMQRIRAIGATLETWD